MRLHPSFHGNKTGYTGVCQTGKRNFAAKHQWYEGQGVNSKHSLFLGTFPTALEAAVAYAKHVGPYEGADWQVREPHTRNHTTRPEPPCSVLMPRCDHTTHPSAWLSGVSGRGRCPQPRHARAGGASRGDGR
jgi:hypothetical protein